MAKKPNKRTEAETTTNDALTVPGQTAVTIVNHKSVRRATIPLAPGHITVLTGSNGCGKSESLEAINALAQSPDVPDSEKIRLELSDGAEEGEVSGLGITIRVSRTGRNKKTGELEVVAIEDGMKLAEFVDPGLKDDASADLRRIKAAASMLGVRIDPQSVAELLDPANPTFGMSLYEKHVTTKTRRLTNAVEFVEGVKRDLFESARDREFERLTVDGEIQQMEATLSTVDLEAESDQQKLADALEAAVSARSELAERQRNAKAQAEQRQRYQELLDKNGATAAFNLTAAQEVFDKAMTRHSEQIALVAKLKQELADAELRQETTKELLDSAETQLETAKDQHEDSLTARRALDEAAIVEPTAAELEAAQKAYDDAQAAIIKGQAIRDASAKRTELATAKTRRDGLASMADRLRRAGEGLVNLLAKPINDLNCGLRVTPLMRLVTTDHPRGEIYLSELSPGEGWALALSLATRIFEKAKVPGLLAVPQIAYEGLDGHNRKLFREAVAKTQLMVVTAEASRDDEDVEPLAAHIEGAKP